MKCALCSAVNVVCCEVNIVAPYTLVWVKVGQSNVIRDDLSNQAGITSLLTLSHQLVDSL